MNHPAKGKEHMIKKIQIIGIVFIIVGALIRFDCIPVPERQIIMERSLK